MSFINITPDVQVCLLESGIKEGLLLVNAMHITASVFINDDESGLHQDFGRWLEELAPHTPLSRYRHNLTGEDNGDAHLKRQVMGREVVVAISEGRLDFLRRIRRPQAQAGAGEDHRRIGPGPVRERSILIFVGLWLDPLGQPGFLRGTQQGQRIAEHEDDDQPEADPKKHHNRRLHVG
jgi:secondary thiamine-phosphate synthase enzyme